MGGQARVCISLFPCLRVRHTRAQQNLGPPGLFFITVSVDIFLWRRNQSTSARPTGAADIQNANSPRPRGLSEISDALCTPKVRTLKAQWSYEESLAHPSTLPSTWILGFPSSCFMKYKVQGGCSC